MKKILKWWREQSHVTNGNQLTTWFLLILIPLGGVWGIYQYYESEKETTCEGRIEARGDIRRVVVGIYDFAERFGEDENIQLLRIQLNNDLPMITLSQCLAGS